MKRKETKTRKGGSKIADKEGNILKIVQEVKEEKPKVTEQPKEADNVGKS